MNPAFNLFCIFGGATNIALCTFLGTVDVCNAVNDKQNRAKHITALAIDIIMIVGSAMTIAGGVHGNLLLVFMGGSIATITSIARIIFLKNFQPQTVYF